MPDHILFLETLAVALGMIMAYSPVIVLILARKRLGALKTATALVVWGTLIPTFEHASFAIYGSRTFPSLPGHGLHLHYHFFMAGIFTVVAGIMITIIATSQLRQGEHMGWYAILAALLIGGGFELSGAAGILFHGFQTSWAMGLRGLFALFTLTVLMLTSPQPRFSEFLAAALFLDLKLVATIAGTRAPAQNYRNQCSVPC